jgi:hypothetical protein
MAGLGRFPTDLWQIRINEARTSPRMLTPRHVEGSHEKGGTKPPVPVRFRSPQLLTTGTQLLDAESHVDPSAQDIVVSWALPQLHSAKASAGAAVMARAARSVLIFIGLSCCE